MRRPGRWRQITIEQAVDVADGAGGVSRSWDFEASVWASFRLLRGAPRDRADREALTSVWSVRLRWRDDLDGTRRLRDGGRVFVILRCGDPDGRRAWTELQVGEETP